mgnify:CR=1 FL=1
MAATLLESALFGHERGAFTGAHSQRVGPFEYAAGGTVVTPKTSLGPIGFIAVLDDTEGNRVGLHMPV